VASDGTQANRPSYRPSISADGRYVAFSSGASNLVPGDTNYWVDVFGRDCQTGETTRVSVASDGTQANYPSYRPSISADGRFVAFDSQASNLVANDTNGRSDVFVHDRQTGETSRVSVRSDGTQGTGGNSYIPRLSADGRYVAFYSEAPNLVAGDTNGFLDVFVHDHQTGQTTRVSVRNDGGQGNEDSAWPAISADGRYVAFYGEASNLVVGDTNGVWDVFAHGRETGETFRVSVASGGRQGNRTSLLPSISADGRCVAFSSEATNLVSGDHNGKSDAFVHAHFQPDMMIRDAGDAAFVGNDVYNATGTGQEKAQAVASGAMATYQFQVQNDGSAHDRLTVRGPRAELTGESAIWTR
jgi:Tol biopolymer transport system component